MMEGIKDHLVRNYEPENVLQSDDESVEYLSLWFVNDMVSIKVDRFVEGILHCSVTHLRNGDRTYRSEWNFTLLDETHPLFQGMPTGAQVEEFDHILMEIPGVAQAARAVKVKALLMGKTL